MGEREENEERNATRRTGQMVARRIHRNRLGTIDDMEPATGWRVDGDDGL